MAARSLIFVLVLIGVSSGVTPSSAATAGPGPWVLQNGTESGGYPLGGGGPLGTEIRFIDRGSFWIGVLLRNTSKTRLTIVGAKTPEPAHSLAGQVGAAFAPYTPCPGDRLCPYLGDPRHPPSPAPLTVVPGHFVAVKLSYRLVGCTKALTSTTVSGDSLTVAYRVGSGSLEQSSFSIGGAKLLLARPVGEACLPRPHSYIGLVGSFTTSPEHRALPGSDGDTCSLSVARGLSFRSREFFDRDQGLWRVEIHLPLFKGTGRYGAATGKSTVLGPAEITVIGAFGLHGHTTFIDRHGTVTLTKARPPVYSGRLDAVLFGHRRFFRTYGTWRCTTRLK